MFGVLAVLAVVGSFLWHVEHRWAHMMTEADSARRELQDRAALWGTLIDGRAFDHYEKAIALAVELEDRITDAEYGDYAMTIWADPLRAPSASWKLVDGRVHYRSRGSDGVDDGGTVGKDIVFVR